VIPEQESVEISNFEVKESVRMSRLDSVLPVHERVDFVFINTKRGEIEALEGLRDVVGRSSNLIVMSRWAGLWDSVMQFRA
jgi:hypothetical protein